MTHHGPTKHQLSPLARRHLALDHRAPVWFGHRQVGHPEAVVRHHRRRGEQPAGNDLALIGQTAGTGDSVRQNVLEPLRRLEAIAKIGQRPLCRRIDDAVHPLQEFLNVQ